MIKSKPKQSKKSKQNSRKTSSRSINPRMSTKGKIEEKFGLELDAIAENIRKKYEDYIYEYELWLSDDQEKRLKSIMNNLYKLAAELS